MNMEMLDGSLAKVPAINVMAGSRGTERVHIPILQGRWPRLPSALDALVLVGDLQACDREDVVVEDRSLIGHVVSRELHALSVCGLLPPADRMGVLLAGDFYTNPDLKRRGTTGDVEDVWISFAKRFGWIAGVAGNHDLFAGRSDFGNVFRNHANVHPLDGDVREIDGLKIGGISGIFGTPGRKPWRHDYDSFEKAFHDIMSRKPDILLLHEGPDYPPDRLRGSAFIRELLEALPEETKPDLVVNGHCHWPKPMVELGASGPTVMNVDARAVVLVRD